MKEKRGYANILKDHSGGKTKYI